MSDTEKKRRWLMPALVISLTLNLLVIGIVVGAIASGGGRNHTGKEAGPARGFIGEPFLRALPREDRRALGRTLRENPGAIQATRAELGKRIDTFLGLLRSDDFDANTAAQVLSEQRSLVIGRQKQGERILLERLASMSAEDRFAYADRLEKALKHVRKRRN